MPVGFEDMSKEEAVETCRKIFEPHLGGHELISNAAHLRGSAVWMNFPRVICEKWHHENVVLMGDAAATGHFSIGSGTRLAFDSAISLATYLHSEPTMEPPSPAIRRSAGSRCCACNRRRATALNGSNRWSVTSISTRCSSTIPC
jgi:2-polyprenyl-6-methoxyphenol hydroxylase-like FAD-dependent oxidoreductase